MKLAAAVSIPRSDGELNIDSAKLKKLREKGLPMDWYVLFAIQLSYSHKNPSLLKEHFCEEWGIAEHDLDGAIAKLQKKGFLHRPESTIQLELFEAQPIDNQPALFEE